MGLTMHERKAITNELSGRYQKATKTAKGQIAEHHEKISGPRPPCTSGWGPSRFGIRVEVPQSHGVERS